MTSHETSFKNLKKKPLNDQNSPDFHVNFSYTTIIIKKNLV